MPKSVCLSVCPFVCYTREPRLNGSRYRNMLCTTRFVLYRAPTLKNPGYAPQLHRLLTTLFPAIMPRTDRRRTSVPQDLQQTYKSLTVAVITVSRLSTDGVQVTRELTRLMWRHCVYHSDLTTTPASVLQPLNVMTRLLKKTLVTVSR